MPIDSQQVRSANAQIVAAVASGRLIARLEIRRARAKNFADAIVREAHAEIQWLAPHCASAVASGAELRACAKPRSVKMQAPSSMKHEDGAEVWKIFARGENPRGGNVRP
jgi:hypothetical protein